MGGKRARRKGEGAKTLPSALIRLRTGGLGYSFGGRRPKKGAGEALILLESRKREWRGGGGQNNKKGHTAPARTAVKGSAKKNFGKNAARGKRANTYVSGLELGA